jgi:hypothetical protein
MCETTYRSVHRRLQMSDRRRRCLRRVGNGRRHSNDSGRGEELELSLAADQEQSDLRTLRAERTEPRAVTALGSVVHGRRQCASPASGAAQG